jgi:hypothetical protein
MENRRMRTFTSSWARAAALAALPSLGACGGETPAAPADPGTCSMQEAAVANEGWSHVTEGSAITYAHNPPASGPHYPVWLRYESYDSTMARGYWVHNLEHGAVVLLYRPSAPAAVIDTMKQMYRALPSDPACGHTRALLTPDPLLGTDVAVVAANFALTGSCVGSNAVLQFVNAHRNRAPEQICDQGQRP